MGEHLCRDCGKPPQVARAGSLTSYFFPYNYCQCSNKQSPSQRPTNSNGADSVCPNCGKSRPTNRRLGSFTSFLFQELRCKCAGAGSNSRSHDSQQSAKSLNELDKRTTTAHRFTEKKRFTQGARRLSTLEKTAKQTDFRAGDIVGGVFKIISVIGRGGMGVVYCAELVTLRKQFALKILSPEVVNEQSWLRFQAEARTLAALNHPALIKVYDLGIHERTVPYYSMDLMHGCNLEEKIVAEGPLSLDQALDIFIEVLDGLAYAHRNGIIHRDLKPANIMLCTANGEASVKILDFGISKLLFSSPDQLQNLTSAGEVFGSPYYMSPEQCQGEAVDARSDIYSIGCALFEVLSGFVPFEGRNSLETVALHEDEKPPRLADLDPAHKYPPSVDLAIAKCLAKLPQNRYQSAKELAIDLSRIREGKNLLHYSSAPLSEQETVEQETVEEDHEAGNPRLVLVISAAAFVMLILGAAGLGWFISQPPSAQTRWNTGANQIGVQPGSVSDGAVGFAEEVTGEPTGSERETRPYSAIEIVAGRKWRSFRFPSDITIGYLSHSSDKHIYRFAATGALRVPAEIKNEFEPSPVVAKYPQYLTRFREGDVESVSIAGSDKFEQVLAAVSSIPGVKSLGFAGSAQLNSNCIASLNKFRQLKSFTATEGGALDSAILAKANCWNQLENFDWSAGTAVAPMLKKLQSCPGLRSLFIANSPLLPSDYLLIAKLSPLRILSIRRAKMSLADLAELSRLNKLNELSVFQCGLKEDSSAVLAKFDGLLWLRLSTMGNDSRFISSMRRLRPGLKIIVQNDKSIISLDDD